jgi:hypothetical protein
VGSRGGDVRRGSPRPFSWFSISNSDVVNKQVTTTLADGTPIPGGFVAQSDPPYYPSMTSGPLVESFTKGTQQDGGALLSGRH